MEKGAVSKSGPIVKGLVAGVAAGVVILLLFGLLGKNWLIGVLAGVCCGIGFFSMGYAWFYLKAVEKYYKAHPELIKKDKEAEPSQEPTEDE